MLTEGAFAITTHAAQVFETIASLRPHGRDRYRGYTTAADLDVFRKRWARAAGVLDTPPSSSERARADVIYNRLRSRVGSETTAALWDPSPDALAAIAPRLALAPSEAGAASAGDAQDAERADGASHVARSDPVEQGTCVSGAAIADGAAASASRACAGCPAIAPQLHVDVPCAGRGHSYFRALVCDRAHTLHKQWTSAANRITEPCMIVPDQLVYVFSPNLCYEVHVHVRQNIVTHLNTEMCLSNQNVRDGFSRSSRITAGLSSLVKSWSLLARKLVGVLRTRHT